MENRLIRVTLDSINKQRVANGQTAVTADPTRVVTGMESSTYTDKTGNVLQGASTPVVQTAAQANAALQTSTAKSPTATGSYDPQKQYTSLADAQAAADASYQQTGSVDQNAQAAIDRYNNPSLVPTASTTATPTSSVTPVSYTSPYLANATKTVSGANAKTAPVQIADINKQIDELQNKGVSQGTSGNTASEVDKANENAANQASIAALEDRKQKIEQNLRDAQKHELEMLSLQKQNLIPTPTDTPTQSNTSTVDPSINPDVQAAFADLQKAVTTGDQAGMQAAMERWTALSQDNSVADAASKSKDMLAADETKQYDMAQQEHQLQLDRAAEVKRQQEFDNSSTQAQFTIDQAKQENDQRIKNIETEQRNRNIAASLGINHDTNGLKWMGEEVRKGDEMLTYLKETGIIQSSKFMEDRRRTAENYLLNTRDADLSYDKVKGQISSDYQANIAAIDKTVNLDQKDRDKQKFDLMQGVFDKMSEADKEHATNLKEIRLKSMDIAANADKDLMAKQNNAFDNLMKAVDTYGGNVPSSILSTLQKDLPGIDVKQIASTPSLKSVEDARKATLDTINDPQSFTDQESKQLMYQAKQVSYKLPVASQGDFQTSIGDMLRSGDIEGAKNYMYTQIANNLTGTDNTNYQARADQNVMATGILTSLEQNPNYKGFDYFHAMTQQGLAKIGKASPEYNAIMAPTLELNSQILHQLSGAAISPSEYTRLKGFLPLAGEGKDVAKTKLNSFVKYNTWLNQARIAREVGLPIPSDPTLTQAEADAPKPTYNPSNDSINSVIRPQASRPLLDVLAEAHQQHEGYGSANAKTITAGNNPGALRWTDGQAKFGGTPGPKGFTVFPSYEDGKKALIADLQAKLTGGSSHIDYSHNPTFLDYVKVYAPTADGNNPNAYAQALVASLQDAGYSVTLSTPLSQIASLLG